RLRPDVTVSAARPASDASRGLRMELTCTSFSFPLLSFERSLRQIALLDIPNVDLGAHAAGRHLRPDRIEADPRREAEAVRTAADAAGAGHAGLFPTFGHGFRDRSANSPGRATPVAKRRRFPPSRQSVQAA